MKVSCFSRTRIGSESTTISTSHDGSEAKIVAVVVVTVTASSLMRVGNTSAMVVRILGVGRGFRETLKALDQLPKDSLPLKFPTLSEDDQFWRLRSFLRDTMYWGFD